MRKLAALTLSRLSMLSCFVVLLTSLSTLDTTVQADNIKTVEGEWEIISVSSDVENSLIGSKVVISRKGEGYEVKGTVDSVPLVYSGNERRIASTKIEDLCDPNDVSEGANKPDSVKRYFAGKQAPINYSYTLSEDGNFLTRTQDYKRYFWEENAATGDVRNVRYEIVPDGYKRTLKRIFKSQNPSFPMSGAAVSEPVNKTFPAVAQMESRGEFYFLTKDGRKLTGDEAGNVPLEEGAKVVTGNDGHVKMTLPDNTTFTVGPNSDLVIDKFVYDPATASGAITADLSKGVFRWVTGKIARKDQVQMRVTLPVGTIGIRGTDFETTIEPNGTGSIVLNFGQLEITEKKTGFKFLLEAGEKVTFGADGSFSRPLKI